MTINTYFGKYRDLLLAIVLFLVIDIGVLAFNVVASHEIERDASEINTAGELRMVSQQLAKATLTLEDELHGGQATQTSLAQILEASDEFDEALSTLERSKPGFFGNFLSDNEARSERNRLISELSSEWQPLGRAVRAMLAKKDHLQNEDIEPVSNRSVARNLKLLQLADDLTQQLEDISRGKTTDIRTIQLTAIALALLNFIFIIFKFIRQLNASDRQAETARRETIQILGTVHQGLFLLHADGRIGEQRSASLDELFGRKLAPHARFMEDVLSPLIKDAEQKEMAASYVSMLFDKKVKPSLLASLNPLVELEATMPVGHKRRLRYLTFAFEQVKTDDSVDALLVSVIDVTQEVLLKKELSEAQTRTKSEIELLIGVIDQEPTLVQAFLADARSRINEINAHLQSIHPTPSAYRQAVESVGRHTHAIKGEAALLSITPLENQAHTFENQLSALRKQDEIVGDDLISVAFGVNELLERIDRIDAIVGKVARFASPQNGMTSPLKKVDALQPIVSSLKALGEKIANDLHKEVFFEVDFPPVTAVPDEILRICREVLPQLVRNAVAHGIEDGLTRQQEGKSTVGHILVRFEFEGASGYRVRVRDDGAGLSLQMLKAKAVASGRYSEMEVQEMGDHRLISMLFEPGFSTQERPTLHAGRGDGMAVVREVIQNIGARLRVLSTARSFTEFVIYKKA